MKILVIIPCYNEAENIAGVVRRLSAKHGLPTPANDFFYQRIRAIEASWQN